MLISLKKEISWRAYLNSGEIQIPKYLTSADTGRVLAAISFTFLLFDLAGEILNEKNLHSICFCIIADKFSIAVAPFPLCQAYDKKNNSSPYLMT